MSCNYADGLSQYDYKGILGTPEKFDNAATVKEKCRQLAEIIKNSKHVVVHTGAGISTSAGIPDFRGPKGVWTLEEKGLKPDMNMSFTDAIPTKTHMALKQLTDSGIVKYVVSQNIDGLHLKSGMKREYLAELHGNMFVEQCNVCKRQFIRSSPAPTVGQKDLKKSCSSSNRLNGRPCRGKLHDVILDWEHSLPDDDLDMADMHSSIADLSICLGTTLQIVPSGNIPLNTPKYGGKLVICNLQPTKHDNKADLIINTYVDNVMEEVLGLLDLKIPNYVKEEDPSFTADKTCKEWTIPKSLVSELKVEYKKKCDGVPRKRVLVKSRSHIPIKKKKSRKTYYIKESDSSESEDSSKEKIDKSFKSENLELNNDNENKRALRKRETVVSNLEVKNKNKRDLKKIREKKNVEIKNEPENDKNIENLEKEIKIDLTKNSKIVEDVEIKKEKLIKSENSKIVENLDEVSELSNKNENSTNIESLESQDVEMKNEGKNEMDVTENSANIENKEINIEKPNELENDNCLEDENDKINENSVIINENSVIINAENLNKPENDKNNENLEDKNKIPNEPEVENKMEDLEDKNKIPNEPEVENKMENLEDKNIISNEPEVENKIENLEVQNEKQNVLENVNNLQDESDKLPKNSEINTENDKNTENLEDKNKIPNEPEVETNNMENLEIQNEKQSEPEEISMTKAELPSDETSESSNKKTEDINTSRALEEKSSECAKE